jgi:tRNA-specific 2-thiouridylase
VKTVYVALSGGVDSSVAALLLKRRGFRVIGVFMKPWQEPGVRCLWQVDRQDTLRVAATLDIPLKTWDFSRHYGRKVTKAMVAGYRKGITPNPDVECNREIKFGLFYKRAIKEGADFIATGHYARITGGYLAKARDGQKDQTYFLWAIKPSCLKRTIFPIGHLTKPQVRVIAARAGLITADKKDSQGVCFVGEMDVKSFLTHSIKPRPGDILHTDGRRLGRHDGAAYYTIGQRHGLDIKDGGGPYYVIRKNIRRNVITVGVEGDLYGTATQLAHMNWFGPRPVGKVSVKIRYRTIAVPATLDRTGGIIFTKPARAITPGQSAVIYRGARLLGGGVIKE